MSLRVGSWFMRISVFIRRDMRELSLPMYMHWGKAMWEHSQKVAMYKPQDSTHQKPTLQTSDLRLPTSITVRKKFFLLFKPPSLWWFLNGILRRLIYLMKIEVATVRIAHLVETAGSPQEVRAVSTQEPAKPQVYNSKQMNSTDKLREKSGKADSFPGKPPNEN